MRQVWWKHSWEDICNVWAPGRTLHSGWLWGWDFDLVLGLWATSDRNVTQTGSSRSEMYSMWRRGGQPVCERGRCAAGPQVQPGPGVQPLRGSSGVSCLSFSLYAHFMFLSSPQTTSSAWWEGSKVTDSLQLLPSARDLGLSPQFLFEKSWDGASLGKGFWCGQEVGSPENMTAPSGTKWL